MILEGIVTTVGPDGGVNIAPMGAAVDDPYREPLCRLVLRPYQTSQTFVNLRRTGQGVFHVTDHVELIARAAVNRLDRLPELLPVAGIHGWIVADACRWYALRVRRLDDSQPRAEIEGEVVEQGRLRDFFGLNRAKHAVLEAAILATRLAFIPVETIRDEMARLAVLVEKTGGTGEREAFRFLVEYVAEASRRHT